VRYLDCVDFGSVMLPPTLPRIRVWKGDLIKHFSNMDIGLTGKYGAHAVSVLFFLINMDFCCKLVVYNRAFYLFLIKLFHFFCQVKDISDTCYKTVVNNLQPTCNSYSNVKDQINIVGVFYLTEKVLAKLSFSFISYCFLAGF
jgi:hypothetical protein